MNLKQLSVPKYSLSEELLNSISHGVGALLGVLALVLGVIKSIGDPWKAVSMSVFGASLILLYATSCLYHALKVNLAKKVFRILDHCSIFILIAGTYTPYTLVALRDGVGWWLFGVVWGAAALGITLNAIDLKKYSIASVFCYIAMGWVAIFSYSDLVAYMGGGGTWLLIGGGIAYTLGAVLYAVGSKRKYFHSVFHFFCLVGSILQFLSIYLYVL